MHKIVVQVEPRKYSVLIASGSLPQAGQLVLANLPNKPSRLLLLAPAKVMRLWGKPLERSLRDTGVPITLLPVNDKESEKSPAQVAKLMDLFAKAGADRKSAVIAFGGGVTGDVAGFAASIFMRGIPVIQVPTTLLSQVDASVGGKTGVNLKAGKNLVGSFHQPHLVLIDPMVLKTLSEREFRAGLQEVIKCGIIADRDLFHFMQREKRQILKRAPEAVEQIVRSCVAIKASIVAQDERETGLRRVLNYGHTIGHALEAAGGYKKYLHGEAVALGMIAAANIGKELRAAPDADTEAILALIKSYGPFPKVSENAKGLLKLVKGDKKSVNGAMNFVLASEIGSARVSKDVTESHVVAAVQQLHRLR